MVRALLVIINFFKKTEKETKWRSLDDDQKDMRTRIPGMSKNQEIQRMVCALEGISQAYFV